MLTTNKTIEHIFILIWILCTKHAHCSEWKRPFTHMPLSGNKALLHRCLDNELYLNWILFSFGGMMIEWNRLHNQLLGIQATMNEMTKAYTPSHFTSQPAMAQRSFLLILSLLFYLNASYRAHCTHTHPKMLKCSSFNITARVIEHTKVSGFTITYPVKFDLLQII